VTIERPVPQFDVLPAIGARQIGLSTAFQVLPQARCKKKDMSLIAHSFITTFNSPQGRFTSVLLEGMKEMTYIINNLSNKIEKLEEELRGLKESKESKESKNE